jgi:RimJ/RimL family protein N-acetyltransferase
MSPRLLGIAERLQFEQLCQLHLEDLFTSLTDARIYQHIGESYPKSIDDLSNEIERLSTPPPRHLGIRKCINVAIRRIDVGQAIGRLEATLVDRRAEIAFLLGPNHWGRGFATEAMQWWHSQLINRENVLEFWATVRPANDRSIRLLQSSATSRKCAGGRLFLA